MPFDSANYDAPVIAPSHSSVTKLLEHAWSLIDQPHKWCRGQFRSTDGRRHCSLGAIETTFFESEPSLTDAIAARDLLARAMGGHPVPFNDNHTHREVAAAWQRAIALSRQP